MALGETVHSINWPSNSNANGCNGWYSVSWNKSCYVRLFSDQIGQSKEASHTGFPIHIDKSEINKATDTKYCTLFQCKLELHLQFKLFYLLSTWLPQLTPQLSHPYSRLRHAGISMLACIAATVFLWSLCWLVVQVDISYIWSVTTKKWPWRSDSKVGKFMWRNILTSKCKQGGAPTWLKDDTCLNPPITLFPCTQPPVQWLPGLLPGDKTAGHGSNHPSPSSAKV
jgi:hypothetical protein